MALKLKFRILAPSIAVCRLSADANFPAWACQGSFSSITRSPDELSVVCEEKLVPADLSAERNWLALKLEGPFPFSMTGVLAALIEPLATARIPVFAIATFDTDYVLIKREDRDSALRVLHDAGHELLASS